MAETTRLTIQIKDIDNVAVAVHDLPAGTVIESGVAMGETTIAEVGTDIFNMILDVASGIREPYSDQYGFHNDMCIFNPAPIT